MNQKKGPSLRSQDKGVRASAATSARLVTEGLALHRAGRMDDAKTLYKQALKLAPHDPAIVQLLAALLIQQQQLPDAISLMQEALRRHPDDINMLNNLGAALISSGRAGDAITILDRALLLDATDHTARKNRSIAELRTRPTPASIWQGRQKLCDWTNRDHDFDQILQARDRPDTLLPPFQGLMTDEPDVQLEIARRWSHANFKTKRHRFVSRDTSSETRTNRKTRIGYFSADFHNHAVMVLLAGVLEHHDHQNFEIYGFSFGHDSNDAMRRRARASFDRLIDVSGASDEGIAALSRSLEIDVALDLSGYTQDARPGMFAFGAAPIQINYLGYPGTMGSDFHDYIIADTIIVPDTHRHFYSEKVITLAGSYQPNDNTRQISNAPISRRSFGLPDEAFVYCCFNNSFKITPEVFQSWMRILHQVPNSVLWLLETDEVCSANLRREVENACLDPSRLVFARKLPGPEHLARHRLADLFLDTLPYNAHTTASDALYAGLPVLTRMGNSFASRVAASLNNTMGLPELVTTTVPEYEAMAIALASDPKRLHDLRVRAQHGQETSLLFNTRAYTTRLEAAVVAALARFRSGLDPDHMAIA